MNLESESSTALYIQLASYFRAQIESGALPPDSRLPSEIQLAEDHDISRGTVRHAMNILVTEGLVERVPGKGTFVRSGIPAPTALIGAILPYVHDTLTLDILSGIEQTAKRHDYQVVFAQTEERLEMEAADIQRMREQNVAGLILFPLTNLIYDELIEDLLSDNVPLVLVDRYFPDQQTNVVVADNFGGGYQATEHLIKLGHRRIGFVAASPLTTTSIRDRFQGYRKALAAHHLPYTDTLLLELSDDIASYLRAPNHPTAVFACNDFTAKSVMRTAQKFDIHIPKDLAVVGFDDTREAAELWIPLTTVAQYGRQVGARACEVLLRQIADPHHPPRHEILPVELIVRRSCGAKLNWKGDEG